MDTNKLNIDYENNVLFLEIENNDYFDESTLSPEEAEEIKKTNANLTDTFITSKLLSRVDVCGCQMEEYAKKRINRAKLLNVNPMQQVGNGLEQEDVDKFLFSVIVATNNSRMDPEPLFIGRECKYCHKLEMWGDVDILTRVIAESTANKISNQQAEAHPQQEAEEPQNTQPQEVTDVMGNLMGGLVGGMLGNMMNNATNIVDANIVKDDNVEVDEEPVENTEPAE